MASCRPIQSAVLELLALLAPLLQHCQSAPVKSASIRSEALILRFHVYSYWLTWRIKHWRRMLLLVMGHICACYILRLSSSCKALYTLPHHGDLLGRLGRSLGHGQDLHWIKLHREARHSRLVSQDASGQPATDSLVA